MVVNFVTITPYMKPNFQPRLFSVMCRNSIQILVLLIIVSGLLYQPMVNAVPITELETLSDQIEIDVNKYPADGQQLILWIAPSFGFQQSHNDMAQLLNQQGFEVWMADINEALFLPHNSTAMREINAKYVADLVEIAHKKSAKQIILMSGSYGAIPVLRGAHLWLLRKPQNRYLLGAVLFSPNVYQKIPPLGVEPDYLPIAYATTIPVIIFQGTMNSNRWQLDKFANTLRSSGGFVHTELIPDTVDLFYGSEHPPQIEDYFRDFAKKMKTQVELLKNNPYPLQAKALKEANTSTGTGLDSQIKPFKGDPKPHTIRLKDINGKLYEMGDYRGRVVVVNFWATWCTPCIKEIPSLNNLRNLLKDKPFQLISINYAETPDTIREFMKMVNVEFPVLVDEQGLEAAKWKVIVFPSTFIIGADGVIRYGVNAGIEWDAPEVINTIEQLISQKR